MTATSRRALPGWASAAVLSLLLTAASLVAPPPALADSGSFVSMINAERASAGLPALSTSGELASVAAGWSDRMASSGTLAHNPGLASQVSGYRFVGENVGYGPDSGTIHGAFMASPAHRANILDDDYTQVGVAVTTGEGGRIWVTEVFRQPTGAAASGPRGRTSGSAPAPAPPPPTPEQLLQQRAAAAVAGPGALPVPDVLAQTMRFTQVMAGAHG